MAPSIRRFLEILSTESGYDQVRDALDLLPANERMVFVLVYWEGLSRTQVARSLGIPIGEVIETLDYAWIEIQAHYIHSNLTERTPLWNS